jgi:hypothetical protein
MTQSTKPKEKDEAGSSMKKKILTDNTRKAAMLNQPSRSNTVPKIPRRKTTMTRTNSYQDTIKGDTSQAGKERVQVTTSGVQPSDNKESNAGRRGEQKKEVCHERPSHHPYRG